MTTAVQRKIRQTLSDLFTFVRSQEVNRAIAAVTQEQLIEEQILRNGESSLSSRSQFNPYSYNPDEAQPASEQSLKRANFAGGSDVNLPTKMDRLVALKNELDDLVEEIKNIPPSEISAPDITDSSDEDLLLTAEQLEQLSTA
jgi:hypothetical protein